MKNLITKIWAAMCSVPARDLWLFTLGETVCLIIGVLIPKWADFAIFFPCVATFVIFFLAQVKHKNWVSVLFRLLWALGGALVPQIFFWIAA